MHANEIIITEDGDTFEHNSPLIKLGNGTYTREIRPSDLAKKPKQDPTTHSRSLAIAFIGFITGFPAGALCYHLALRLRAVI